MIDLSTTYMGLQLKNPIVASASPLCDSVDKIRLLEDHGIAAVVLPSLFEEQLILDSESVDADLSRGAEAFPESASFLPELDGLQFGTGRLSRTHSQGEKIRFDSRHRQLEWSHAGRLGAIRARNGTGRRRRHRTEYLFAGDRPVARRGRGGKGLLRTGAETAGKSENPHRRKTFPFFQRHSRISRAISIHPGANALVLFNRFYQPDLDIDQLEVVPSLTLSHPSELLLRLHWIAVIYGHIGADMAVTGGVHSAEDVLKSVMAGARVAMMTSALLQNGVEHLDTVLSGVVRWMEEHEYESIRPDARKHEPAERTRPRDL